MPGCTSHMLSNLYSFPELLTIAISIHDLFTWLEGLSDVSCNPRVVYKLKLEIKCQHLVVTLYIRGSLLSAWLGCEGNGEFCRADASLLAK